uniref:Retrotrans_gag domain-containing protein n=1 Tax=Glossina pallidipes TaxID=7398 RepID=A0A1B0A7L5_GLOPL
MLDLHRNYDYVDFMGDNLYRNQPRTSDESARKRNVDWHLKFDDSGKGLTVESFVFRVEHLRQQQPISHGELFAEFHCLVTGPADIWYWQLLEDREEDPIFNYRALKVELLNQFKTADSDYELIREMMERKQHQSESFENYYAEMHDLTFRLRKKTRESELIKIIKSNVKPEYRKLNENCLKKIYNNNKKHSRTKQQNTKMEKENPEIGAKDCVLKKFIKFNNLLFRQMPTK